MTANWIAAMSGAAGMGTAAAFLAGRRRETATARRMAAALAAGAPRFAPQRVDLSALQDLPPPVARYFRHVLSDGQQPIAAATMRQAGTLRTDTASAGWRPFTASQFIAPPATGFVWNARVGMPFALHVRVLDSYIAGVGAGRVSLLSAFAVASDAGAPELNAGALHRYLAEAVWYPTALLPQSGVAWTPIDERAALATLSDRGTTVSLEFRFNDAAEVTGIYSPGRFGRFGGQYRQVPWEGHFRDYRPLAGMRVPRDGEVGWYDDGALQLVWKGRVDDLRYEFAS